MGEMQMRRIDGGIGDETGRVRARQGQQVAAGAETCCRRAQQNGGSPQEAVQADRNEPDGK